LRRRTGTGDPGPQPAGTVFRLSATYRGRTYSSSLTWRGRVRSVTRPVLAGPARFDAVVGGSAATWMGGWGAENDQLGIEACRTAGGRDCVMLNGEELQCPRGGACGSLGAVVDRLQRPDRARVGNWYTGWYLFALDAHRGNDISELVGYSSPAAIPPWPMNATVTRSEPYGPVSGPPAPHVQILRHAQVHGQRVSVASVRCVVRCHVWVTVTRIGENFTPDERIAWSASTVIAGSGMLSVPGPLPRGRMAVSINVGDGPYVDGYTVVH
jgi:hypothetical protein